MDMSKIAPFHDFKTFFREAHYIKKETYRLSVDRAISEAAKRAGILHYTAF